MCILVSFIPSILSKTTFFSGRIRCAIGSSIGILFIHLFTKTDLNIKQSFVNKLIIFTILIYGGINSANYLFLTDLSKKANELDKVQATEIGNYITKYEQENNIKVKNISIIPIYGYNSKAFYKELNNPYIGVAVSAIRTKWAANGIINYYTKLNLTERKYSSEEKKTYLNKVGTEGYLCMGDTIYITTYWN